jgi:hypothetical protein
MNTKTYAKQTQPMSYGPTIEDMRVLIERAEADGVERADMLLRLTFRDASLIKRSPSVGVDEVSFEGGDMRFLGVRISVGPVPLSRLEAPALPDPEPVAAPEKKTKAKAKPKALTAKAKAALAAAEAAEAADDSHATEDEEEADEMEEEVAEL